MKNYRVVIKFRDGKEALRFADARSPEGAVAEITQAAWFDVGDGHFAPRAEIVGMFVVRNEEQAVS